jgi:hypothetical protein
LPIWANFRQRALDVAIREINPKTDLRIKLASIERSKHCRVVELNFTTKTQEIPPAIQKGKLLRGCGNKRWRPLASSGGPKAIK